MAVIALSPLSVTYVATVASVALIRPDGALNFQQREHIHPHCCRAAETEFLFFNFIFFISHSQKHLEESN